MLLPERASSVIAPALCNATIRGPVTLARRASSERLTNFSTDSCAMIVVACQPRRSPRRVRVLVQIFRELVDVGGRASGTQQLCEQRFGVVEQCAVASNRVQTEPVIFDIPQQF